MTDLLALIKQYPIRNSAWTALESCFVAEASCLQSHLLDPWNRKFKHEPEKHFDSEDDLVSWTYQTTVNKQPVTCKIFND